MNNNDLYVMEEWKDIPLDTRHRYQASTLGRIRRVYADGRYRILSQYYETANNVWKVGLTVDENKVRKYSISGLVARTFIGPCKKGYIAIHKNGIMSDNKVSNLMYVEFRKCQHMSVGKRKKAVVKISPDGEIVEYYNSANECAEKNSFSSSGINDRCRGRYKNLLASDGYAYCYEDDSYRLGWIIRKLRRENK